ncbi:MULTISPECIES: hypothetical protein [unclassified Enterobacter]|uniref:gp53-like domain-containing protein n=1 Tax=unclassified Enterobacter TaxID=2608935 RepID=UPI001EEE06AE|nr:MULTISPECIES: hypothetical protein [unclassified Enterobacter]
MALTLLAANNAQTVLAAGISSSATSLTVNTGTGSLFPSPASGTSFFKLTLVDAATGLITEIVHVTARSGDVMTIERAQEGTVARAWSANDIAANMMTAGTLSYVLGNFLSRSNPFGDIKADGTVTTAKTNLGLQSFNNDGSVTTVSAPSGGVFLYVTPSGNWGVQDSAGNALPLPLAGGGTGANTLSGARINLGVQSFATSGTISTVSAPTSGVFFYVSNSGNWGVQDSLGNALPLTIQGGGTGANTLTGARVNLGIAQFGISGSVTAMSSPDSSRSVIIDNAGTWGAQTSTGTVIPLSIARGGTGATDAATARTNLGLGTAATKSVGTAAGQIPDMSAFPYSAVTKGYAKLPNGLIFQWGRISMAAANASGDVAVDSFAISFPNGVLHTYATGGQTLTNTPCFATSEAIDTNQIRLKAIAVNLTDKTITQGMSVTVEWFAIGS